MLSTSSLNPVRPINEGSVSVLGEVLHNKRKRVADQSFLISKLPSELVIYILSFLDARSLTNLPFVCKYLNRFCRTNDVLIWRPLSMSLWEDKQKYAWEKIAVASNLSWQAKYFYSIEESTSAAITEEILCSIPVWGFRFKETAGEHWCSLDPYYTEPNSYMLRKFNPDHSISNPTGEVDLLATYCEQLNLTIKWKITKTRSGWNGKRIGKGHFVKLNSWPSMVATRLPGNWGWVLHNQWVIYCNPPSAILYLDHLDHDIERFI